MLLLVWKMSLTFVTATWKVNSVIGCGTLLENFAVNVIIGSDGEFLVAWRDTWTLESVTVRSFDDGNPLLSGRAEEKAHSSSSFATGTETGGVAVLLKARFE